MLAADQSSVESNFQEALRKWIENMPRREDFEGGEQIPLPNLPRPSIPFKKPRKYGPYECPPPLEPPNYPQKPWNPFPTNVPWRDPNGIYCRACGKHSGLSNPLMMVINHPIYCAYCGAVVLYPNNVHCEVR